MTRSSQVFSTISLLFLATLVALFVVEARAEHESLKRTIGFPSSGVGTFSYAYKGRSFRLLARGLVVLPAGAEERSLVYSHDLSESPLFLKTLKADDLQILILSDSLITDSGCRCLSHLNGLSSLKLDGTDVNDACIKELLSLSQLQYLDLNDTKISDQGIADIAKLPKLSDLCVRQCSISDRALQTLERTQIVELNLDYTPVTDKGMNSLARMPKLKQLGLDSTLITDAGIKAISHAKLGYLSISDNRKITDACIDDLIKMPKLGCLVIAQTKITDNGYARLKKHLPACIIMRDHADYRPSDKEQ